MAIKKYRVLPVEWSDGIERRQDSPVGRRQYVPGDIIELDDKINNPAELVARGQIAEIVEPAPEDAPVETEAAPKASRKGG